MGQKLKNNPKTVAQCRKYPFSYLYTLSRTIPYLYTLHRTIPYLYTLHRTIPYLYTLNRTIPYLNTLSRTVPYLNTLSRTVPYLDTLSRTIPYLNTLNRTHPILIHCRNIPYLNTWPGDPSRPWARVGCYSLSWYMGGHPPPSDQLTHLLLLFLDFAFTLAQIFKVLDASIVSADVRIFNRVWLRNILWKDIERGKLTSYVGVIWRNKLCLSLTCGSVSGNIIRENDEITCFVRSIFPFERALTFQELLSNKRSGELFGYV